MKTKKCEDCHKYFSRLEYDRWCGDCFDIGLSKNMDEHFKQFIEQDMKPTPPKEE